MFKFNPKVFLLLFIFIFSFYYSSTSVNSKEPLTVYITWQKKPESTMTICWITSFDETTDNIEYKLKGEVPWQKAKGFHAPMPEYPYWIHSIELTDLKPDSSYTFKISPQDTQYKFHTMSVDPSKPIRFIDGGDVYHDGIDVVKKMNVQAAKLNPMFAIVGGDIAYNDDKPGVNPKEMPRWLDFLMAWKENMITKEGYLIPIIPAIGNHDVQKKNKKFFLSSSNAPFFYSLFPFPGYQGYNVLDFGSIMSLLILDTDHTHAVQGSQTSWISSILEKRQKIPHKFVSYHVGAFPSYRNFYGTTNSKIRNNWLPLFEKFGVNAVFEHHDHAYKRTWPIRNNKIDFENGILYLGDGAWGVETPRIPTPPESHWYLAKTLSKRHVILVVIHGKERHFMAIDDEGNVIDEVMSKNQ